MNSFDSLEIFIFLNFHLDFCDRREDNQVDCKWFQFDWEHMYIVNHVANYACDNSETYLNDDEQSNPWHIQTVLYH